MARKTRRQKQRAATRQPALAQARPAAAARPEPAGDPGAARAAATPRVAEPEAPPAVTNGTLKDEPAPLASPEAEAPAPARAGEGAVRRRVERIVPEAPPAPSPAAGPKAPPGAAPGRAGRPATQRSRYTSAAAMVAPLESEDPGIPFDRVPYVPADLRRVAVIAVFMVVLILIAWVAVAHITG